MKEISLQLTILKIIGILSLVLFLIATWVIFIFIPFEIAIFFIVALAVLLLALIKTEFMALILLTTAPIMRLPGPEGDTEVFKLCFLGLIVSAWLLKKLMHSQLDEEDRFKPNVLAVPILALSVLLVISFLVSPSKAISVKQLLFHFSCFTSLFMFCDLSKNEKFRERVFVCIFAMAVLTSLLAILQYLIMTYNRFLALENFIIPQIERREFFSEGLEPLTFRSMGTFTHPNLLGMFLAMAFPLMMLRSAYTRRQLERLSLWGALVVVSLALFCVNSRAALLNIAVSVFFIAFKDMRRVYKALLVLFLVAIIMVSVFPDSAVKYMRLAHVFSYRDVLWKNSIVLFLQKPFLGHGLGMFGLKYFGIFGMPSIDDFEPAVFGMLYYGGTISEQWVFPQLIGVTAHNLFLNYAVEAGLLGPILVFWFYIAYLKWAFVRTRCISNGYNKAILLGISALVLGNFVHSFFESTAIFNVLAVNIPLISLLAVSLAMHESNKTGLERGYG